jgi:hypothetical protein
LPKITPITANRLYFKPYVKPMLDIVMNTGPTAIDVKKIG